MLKLITSLILKPKFQCTKRLLVYLELDEGVAVVVDDGRAVGIDPVADVGFVEDPGVAPAGPVGLGPLCWVCS